MELEFFYPIWGSENLPLAEFFAKVKAEGYDGVEMNIPPDDYLDAHLTDLLAEHDLALIAQLYLEPRAESPAEYELRLLDYLDRLASFRPRFINCHTGRDFFPFEDNLRLIEAANARGRQRGVRVVHETHRGRFSYSAFATARYLERLPELRLTADFSHWCCVSESYLADQQDAVAAALPRVDYIHARVGHTQASQVSHPGAPEWAEALEHHLGWWGEVLDHARARGAEAFPICTEFGPVPYLPTAPFTNEPLASQWSVNRFMKHTLTERFAGSVA